MIGRTILTLGLGGLAMGALALGSAALGQASAPALDTDSDAAVYARECALCHGPMGTGTLMLARRFEGDQAQLANRTNLTGPYVDYVVRHGLGSMPAITRVEVTDAQLAQIVRHLTRPQGQRQ